MELTSKTIEQLLTAHHLLVAKPDSDQTFDFLHYDTRQVKDPVSYTHLRAHETDSYLVCRLLLEKKKKKNKETKKKKKTKKKKI